MAEPQEDPRDIFTRGALSVPSESSGTPPAAESQEPVRRPPAAVRRPPTSQPDTAPGDSAFTSDPRDKFSRAGPPTRTLGEQAEVVGQGLATGGIETGGITAGARVGFLATAGVPIPGARVVGTLLGAIGGYFIADQAVEALADPDLTGDTPVTFRSLEDVPEDLRPLAVFGQTLGGAAAPTSAVVGLGRQGVRIVIDPAAGRLKTFAGNLVNHILEMAGKRTTQFVATETAAATTAAGVGAVSEELLPGQAGVRFGAEIVGGLLSPTRLILGTGTDAFKAIKAFVKGATPAARQSKLATQLQEFVEAAGDDPAALAAALRTIDFPEGAQPTVAQALGNRATAAYEAALSEISREFGVPAEIQARQTLDAISTAIILFRNIGKETGDPQALIMAAKLQDDAYRALLQMQVNKARGVADDAAKAITEDTSKARSSVSRTAEETLSEALSDSRSIERGLYDTVEEVPIRTMGNVFKEHGAIRSDMLQRARLPALIERTVQDYRTAQSLLKQAQRAGFKTAEDLVTFRKAAKGRGKKEAFAAFEENVGATVEEVEAAFKLFTTGQLVKFRSEVLEQARKADKDGLDNLARRLGLLAEAALGDINVGFRAALRRGSITKEVARAYNDARAFTRQLHDTFTRAFGGVARVKGRRGELQVPPETLLHRALATGPELRVLHFKELEEATRFLPTQAEAEVVVPDEMLNTAVANADMMFDAQERFLRLSAAEVIGKDGLVDTGKIFKFLRDQEELLDRFPEVRQLLQEAQTTEEARKAVEDTVQTALKRIEQDNAFARVLKIESGADAVKAALNSPKPVQELIALSRLAKKSSPEASRGLHASIWDHVIDTSLRTDGESISLPKLVLAIEGPIRPGLPSLLQVMHQQKLMTLREIATVRELVSKAKGVIETVATLPTGEQVLGGGVEDLTGAGIDILLRMLGSKGATMLAGAVPGSSGAAGPSLIVAYAGSRLMRQVFQRLPKLKLQDLATAAMRGDPLPGSTERYGLAVALLETPKTTRRAIELSRQIHAYAISAGLTFISDGDDYQVPRAKEPAVLRSAVPDPVPEDEAEVEAEAQPLLRTPHATLDELTAGEKTPPAALVVPGGGE